MADTSAHTAHKDRVAAESVGLQSSAIRMFKSNLQLLGSREANRKDSRADRVSLYRITFLFRLTAVFAYFFLSASTLFIMVCC